MKNNLSRVMLCLAALDLTEDELRRLVKDLRSIPLGEISARVSYLQHRPHQYTNRRLPGQFHDASVGERVERLLKLEAGLNTTQAVDKLGSMLTELGLVKRHELPPLSRKSLRDWVGRVAKRVPEKEILRCATVLRNEFVHTPITDWALKGS